MNNYNTRLCNNWIMAKAMGEEKYQEFSEICKYDRSNCYLCDGLDNKCKDYSVRWNGSTQFIEEREEINI